MGGFLTVGHPAAVTAVHAMLRASVPHAILISGPPSVGKRTLALDIAAALLCSGATGADRPCRECRTCRMVEHRNHGDLHVLEPGGAGNQIQIGKEGEPAPGTVRHLIGELALLPIEGGQRVTIVRDADRMGDDAQGALLKTLEEPPPGTTLILSTDDEERLLPTIRSRCARIRLGTVSPRDTELLLTERGLADPPTAARLARLTGGRPGLAAAYAAAPTAVTIRGELVRTLLDLLGDGSATRLAGARSLQARAAELAAAVDGAFAVEPEPESKAPGRGAKGRQPAKPAEDDEADTEDADDAPARSSARDRRRAILQLLDVWRDLARDLVLVERGARTSLRDPGLLEEIQTAIRDLPPGAASEFLVRIADADRLVLGNVTPELLLDVLLIHWPGRRRAA